MISMMKNRVYITLLVKDSAYFFEILEIKICECIITRVINEQFSLNYARNFQKMTQSINFRAFYKISAKRLQRTKIL